MSTKSNNAGLESALKERNYRLLVQQIVKQEDHKSDRLFFHLCSLIPALKESMSESERSESEILDRLQKIVLADALHLCRDKRVSREKRQVLLSNLHELPGIDLTAAPEDQHQETQREYAFMVSPLLRHLQTQH